MCECRTNDLKNTKKNVFINFLEFNYEIRKFLYCACAKGRPFRERSDIAHAQDFRHFVNHWRMRMRKWNWQNLCKISAILWNIRECAFCDTAHAHTLPCFTRWRKLRACAVCFRNNSFRDILAAILWNIKSISYFLHFNSVNSCCHFVKHWKLRMRKFPLKVSFSSCRHFVEY